MCKRQIIYDADRPAEYGAFSLTCYEGTQYRMETIPSIDNLLENYYSSRDVIARIRRGSLGLRRIVQAVLEHNYRKYDPQLKQLRDTERKERYRIYGELLSTYGYELVGSETSFRYLNCYTNGEVTIPLDPQLSAKDNAGEHFSKYNKLKRTYETLVGLTLETKTEIDHLESIGSSLDIARREDNLVQTKEELMEYGHVEKRRPSDKEPKVTSGPFHYLSSDDCHICVGKNSYQNERLTSKLATGNDWWFHAKGIPDSHMIVRFGGKSKSPNRVFEEADFLAAYYSKGRDNDKVEIDYIRKKNIKKVVDSAPGFTIYHTNYSTVAKPGYSLKETESQE